jgi:hypothetical protein
VAEGLSAADAGKELHEHAEHAQGEHHAREAADRWLTIAEAAVLAIVTLVAAWSGYSAAKWGSESSLRLAKSSGIRSKANRAYDVSLNTRVGDALLFNAWLSARSAGDAAAERITVRRFLPDFRPAFTAWLATHPFTNPNAPAGPESMPQYHPTDAALAQALDNQADALYAQGEHAAQTSDDYVRVTVILASVLFIIGMSSHFSIRNVRLAMIAVGVVLLLLATGDILTLPGPP